MGVLISGETVRLDSGLSPIEVPLSVALAAAAERPAITSVVPVPRGVRGVFRRGSLLILVHETLPGLHGMKWIRDDSPIRYGSGAQYRNVRLSLPFVLTFIALQVGRGGAVSSTHMNEAYFAFEPYRSDVPMFHPALLNVSKWKKDVEHFRPLSWICTSNYRAPQVKGAANLSPEMRLERGVERQVKGMVENALLSGFNYSSESHEGQSWYSETAEKSDKRIARISDWEVLSKENPLFGLELKLIPSGHNPRSLAERSFNIAAANSCNSSGVRNSSEFEAVATLSANEVGKEKPKTEPIVIVPASDDDEPDEPSDDDNDDDDIADAADEPDGDEDDGEPCQCNSCKAERGEL